MLTQNQKQQQNMERPSAPVFIFDLTGVYGLLCIWHGGGGTILKFKQKSVRLSGSFSHRFTWTGNHNRTPIISDGATESGEKSVVTDLGELLADFAILDLDCLLE